MAVGVMDDRAAALRDADATTAASARWEWLAPVLVVLHVALAWMARAPMLLTQQDDARYLGLARAIRGGSYRDLMWPGAPLHHMYPPGYPALLAGWTAIGGEGLDWILVLQVLLSAGTLVAIHFAARRRLGMTVSLGTLAVLAVNPSLLQMAGEIVSEGALAVCFALAVWASVAMQRGTRQSVVLLLLALAAPMMRTAGIVLPAALVLHWLVQRRFRDAVVAALLSVVVVGALLWWTFTDPYAIAGSSYAGDLTIRTGPASPGAGRPSLAAEMLRRVMVNLRFYPTSAVPWLLPLPTVAGTAIDNAIGLAGIVVTLAVGLWQAARRWQLGALLVVCTGGLLLVWPYQVERYLVPALPVLVAIMMLGAATVASALRVRPWIVIAVVAAAISGTGLSRDVTLISRGKVCATAQAALAYDCVTPTQTAFFDLAAFLRDSTPAKARVLSSKSEPLHILTGRVTEPLARVVRLDSAAFWGALARDSVEWIVLSEMQAAERPLLAPLLAARCSDLALVRTMTPRMHLLHLAPGAAAGDATACEAIARYQALGAQP